MGATNHSSGYVRVLSVIAIILFATAIIIAGIMILQNRNTGADSSAQQTPTLTVMNTGSVQETSNDNVPVQTEPSTQEIVEPIGTVPLDDAQAEFYDPDFYYLAEDEEDDDDEDDDDRDEDEDDDRNEQNSCTTVYIKPGEQRVCNYACCNFALASSNNNSNQNNTSNNNSQVDNNTNTTNNSSVIHYDCVGSTNQTCYIPNANGIQFRVCQNGNWTPFGKCLLATCNEGYKLQGNDCVPKTNSTANSTNTTGFCSGSSSRDCDIPNGDGIQYRQCFNGTWTDFGICYLQSCNLGYETSGETCKKIVINNTLPTNTTNTTPPTPKTCTGSTNQSCTIPNGIGIQSRTCNDGTWSAFGTCTLLSCNTGYTASSNTCVAKTCVGATARSCLLENGKGMQSRSCVNGEWTSYGPCTTDICNAGYELVSGVCVKQETTQPPVPRSTSTAIIADHFAAKDFDIIPKCWLEKARNDINIAYQHSSHGSQIVSGMDYLRKKVSPTLYAYGTSDTSGSMYFRDLAMNGAGGYSALDLGSTSWDDATESYLDGHSNINTVMWSWCGQVKSYTSQSSMDSHYLSPADDIIDDYDVNFIYMTGHLDGSGPTGSVYKANNLIRSHVKETKGILFDFADIESYDPSGKYYPSETDACSWCASWCKSHPEDCRNLPTCAHSHGLNCVQKAKAFYWMAARISGWDGTATDSCP